MTEKNAPAWRSLQAWASHAGAIDKIVTERELTYHDNPVVGMIEDIDFGALASDLGHAAEIGTELLAALKAVQAWLDRDPSLSPLGPKLGRVAQGWARGAFGTQLDAAIEAATK